LGYKTSNIKNDTETLSGISKDINADRSKYIFMSHQEKAGRNHNINTVNRSFENVAKFKHLGMTATNQI